MLTLINKNMIYSKLVTMKNDNDKNLIQKKEIIKNLEKKGMLQIILILDEQKEVRTTKIQKQITISNDPYQDTRKKLETLGIIKQTDYPFTTKQPYMLTEKGKQIAGYLKEIQKLFI